MKPTRWQQRFENFERAFMLLQSVFSERSLKNFSALEKEGIVQRFEYTFELAWKTLKDYLEFSGMILNQITVREVIKQAFAAKIIEDGQAWINMLEDRNIMSHTYSQTAFEKAVIAIADYYLPALNQVFLFLKQKDFTA